MPKQTGSVEVLRRYPYTQIPNELIRDSDVDPYALAAYCALSSRANSQQRSWPSYALLRKEAHQSNARLSKSLKWLEANGWIVIERRRSAEGRSAVNRYFIQETSQSSRHEHGPEFTTGAPEFTEQTLSGIQEEEPLQQEPEKKNQLALSANRKVAWDFLTDKRTFGMSATTEAQKKRVGRLSRELAAKLNAVDLGSYALEWDEMLNRAGRWAHHFPDATMTAEAFEKHFELLGSPPLKRSKMDVVRQETRDAIANIGRNQ